MRKYPALNQVEKAFCREKLNAASAEWLQNKENLIVSVNKDAEFTRVWWFGTSDDADRCRYFIDYYCDAKNTNAQKWVDDPVVHGKPFKGRYRQAFTTLIESLDENRQPIYGVAQTLRQGWATTIDFSESRLFRQNDLPGNSSGTGNEQSDDPEKWVFIDFPNFNPAAVGAAIAGLSDTYNSLTVEGNSYGNNWHRVTASADRTDDGTMVIRLELARPQYTLNSFSNWGGRAQADVDYLWNVPKDLAQTIITANKATGATVRPTYRGKLVDIVIIQANVDNLDARYDSLESELLTQDTVIYDNAANPVNAPAAAQSAIYRASNSFSSNGGYDARLTYDKSYEKSATFVSERTTFRAGNMLIYRNSLTVITAPAIVGPGVYRVSQRENQDGTYDGSLLYVRGTGTGEVEFSSLNSGLSEEDEVLYKNANAKLDAPADGQGFIYRASNALTDEGQYNSRMVYRGSIANQTAAFNNLTSKFKTGKGIMYKNSRAIIVAPTASGTGIYRVSQNLNADLTYDGMLTFIDGSATGSYEFDSFHGHLNDEVTTIYKSLNQGIAAPADGMGAIYRAENQLTEDGLYNARQIYRTSNSDFLYVAWPTRYGTAENWIYKNQTTFPDLTGLGSATNNSVSPRRNDDGTYDVTVVKTPYGGSGGTDHWDNFQVQWRYRSVSDKGQVYHYVYQTRSQATAEAVLEAAWAAHKTKIVAADINFAGRSRWQTVYERQAT